MMSPLLQPLRVGRYELKNRIVMAPMQRARNDGARVPTAIMEQYYAQRASVGLIVTEASSVSPLSVGRPGAAAIHTDEQARGWSRIAAAIHGAGGLVFQQLYHLGRKSDPSRMPEGTVPVAPSSVAANGQLAGRNGPIPFAVPRALSTDEVPGIVAEFRRGAENAARAGMDGVEIHGANGYIVMQFLCDGTNRRTDRYGGSIANRARLLFEIVEAAVGVWGRDRVGVRISPHFRTDGIGDSDPKALFTHVAAALGEMRIAYLHLIEGAPAAQHHAPLPGAPFLATDLKRAFGGPLIINGGYTLESAARAVSEGRADMVSFASLVIANPDLPERLRRGAPLNEPDRATFYDGGAKGYIDYPALAQ